MVKTVCRGYVREDGIETNGGEVVFITIIAAIFVFGLLVLVHELGHFVTAKMVGMRVDEFAIGFGPKLIGFKRGETLYSLRAVPLGGYNKIAGMDPEDEMDERSYASKPVWARMIVILAGSLMNFVLPVILFFGIFLAVGIHTPSDEPVLGEVIAEKSAARAGLMEGDRIEKINGVSIDSWKQFVEVVQVSDGKVLTVEFDRGGEAMSASLTPEYDESAKRALIGVVSSVNSYQPGVVEAVGLAVERTIHIMYQMMDGLWRLVSGSGSSAELAGPLGVAQMAGEVAQLGFIPLLQFAAFLSINLGIVNLLPVPALDGGHFVTLVIEGARGKPMSAKVTQYAQMVGFALLMCLMLFALFNDVSRFNMR